MSNPIIDDDDFDDILDMDDFDDDDDDFDDEDDDDDFDNDDDHVMKICPICELPYESTPYGAHLICCFCFDYLRELFAGIKRKYAFIKSHIINNHFSSRFQFRYLKIMSYLKEIEAETQKLIKSEGI